MTFQADGNEIRNFTGTDVASGKAVKLDWQGAKKLVLRPAHDHRHRARPAGQHGHASPCRSPRVKTLPATLKTTHQARQGQDRQGPQGVGLRARHEDARAPACRARSASSWQQKRGKKWKTIHGGLKPANKPFTFKPEAQARGHVARAGQVRQRRALQGLDRDVEDPARQALSPASLPGGEQPALARGRRRRRLRRVAGRATARWPAGTSCSSSAWPPATCARARATSRASSAAATAPTPGTRARRGARWALWHEIDPRLVVRLRRRVARAPRRRLGGRGRGRPARRGDPVRARRRDRAVPEHRRRRRALHPLRARGGHPARPRRA